MRVGRGYGIRAAALLLVGLVTETAAGASSVVFERKKVLGLTVNLVTANLNDPKVRVTTALARGGLGATERFASLINRVHPAAAITGTFFDTVSKLPVGDIVAAGTTLYGDGVVGTGVAFTDANQVCFVPLKTGRKTDWRPYEAVVCAGPWLVKSGIRTVRPWAEGFSDPSLYARRPRAAIGVTRHHKLLLVTIPSRVHLTQVSRVMKALGAVNALGMDGGSSTALSFRGRVVSRPSRRLTNVLLVYDAPWRYERSLAQERLAPGLKQRQPEEAEASGVTSG